MIRGPVWLFPLGFGLMMLVVAFIFVVESERPKVAGCQSPPREEKLLDRYEADRAITVGPPGAKGRDPIRTEACVRRNREDITTASVTRRWFGRRSYSEAELAGLYGRAGWVGTTGAGPGGTVVHLRYCAVVETVVSYLQVSHFRDADSTRHEVTVDITAHVDERSCPAHL